MRCEYNDGMKIDYSGTLTIRKGHLINGFIAKKESIPVEVRSELDKAVRHNSCDELRSIAQSFATDCGKVCIK